jgi:hypothetical protein
MKEEEINDLIMELEDCNLIYEGIKFWRAIGLRKYFYFITSPDFRILIGNVSADIGKLDEHKKGDCDDCLLSLSFCKSLVKLLPEENIKTFVASKYFNLNHCGIETIKKELLNN